MIKGDYEYLKSLAKFNMCAEHKKPLEVAWDGIRNSYVLRCGEGHYPDAITRQLSLTQEYKAGEELPEPIKSNVEKSIRRRSMQQGKQPTAITFAGVPATDLATGELLLPEQVKALMDYAYKYHLDPARGHVVLMYGKPYFTIDGYLYHATQSGRSYSLRARPLTKEEEEQYKVGPTDHAWVAELTFTDTGSIFTGLGIVTYDEMTVKSTKQPDKLRSPVVAAHPWQLAQKRAEWQALRRGFPIGETPSRSPPNKESSKEINPQEKNRIDIKNRIE